MSPTPLSFEEAVEIAARAHAGEVDKSGEVYLLHLMRVALAVEPDARRVAILHDLVEDADWTLERLAVEGLQPDEVKAIDLLTKQDGDSYGEFGVAIHRPHSGRGVCRLSGDDRRTSLARKEPGRNVGWRSERVTRDELVANRGNGATVVYIGKAVQAAQVAAWPAPGAARRDRQLA